MATVVRPVSNVLMTCPLDAGVGGVQVVFRDLIHWLGRNGRQVVLVYPAALPHVGADERVNSWGHQSIYCPMPAIVRDNVLLSVPLFVAYLPITFFHLARLIRRKKIDVINGHFLSPYFIHLVIAARLLHVPIVISVHGADVDSYPTSGRAYRLLSRLVMRGANRIVACSEALARRTSEVFPAVREKVTYVHNGLDLSHYDAARTPYARRRPYLLCTARHVHKKGVDVLLRAFSVVVREMPGLSLILAGDGPLMEEHKSLARTLEIEKHVVFAGNVPHADVASLVDGCSVLVLPSREEPFGLVLLEAALFKKPIVCTRVGGIPEIIVDGVNGSMVAPEDPDAMAAQILALLRNPRQAADLGARAYETLMTRFLWQERILDYIAIYEGSPGPSPGQKNSDATRPSLEAAQNFSIKTG